MNSKNILANEIKVIQGDGEIDIIATYNEKLILIQCKNIESSITLHFVKNFESSISRFPKSLGIIVYNSERMKSEKYITAKAKSWIETSNNDIFVCSEKEIINQIKIYIENIEEENFGTRQNFLPQYFWTSS